MVLVKNWQFFHLYILGNIGEENVFHDIVEWKKHFLDHKSNYLKGKFFKRVSQWVWSKIVNFSLFSL